MQVEAAPIHLGEEASLSQDQHTITSENQKEHKEADSKLAGAEVGNWSGPQEDLVDVKGGTPSAGQGSMDVVEPSFAELLPTKSSVIDRPSEGPSCEQLSNSEGKDDSSEDLIPLRLCVQRAANLRLPGSSGSQAGREAAFCVLEWPVDRKVVETPMVPVVGAGADWFHTTYVPAWRQRPVARRREELTSAIIRVCVLGLSAWFPLLLSSCFFLPYLLRVDRQG